MSRFMGDVTTVGALTRAATPYSGQPNIPHFFNFRMEDERMSEGKMQHVFQRLAFELKAIRIEEPIEIYIPKDGYQKLERELNVMQRISSDKYEEGILLYDKVRILVKEPLDFDRQELKAIRKRIAQKVAEVAAAIQLGNF